MSGRRSNRRSNNDGGSDDDDGGQDDRRRRQPHKFEAKLASKDDYDNWRTKLHDFGFSNGLEYKLIIDKGLDGQANQDPNATAEGWYNQARMDVWHAITNSCSPAVRAKHNSIPLGHCEAFIRSIKNEYDHQSETSLEVDRNKLSSAKLSNHADLSALIAYLEKLYERVGKHGEAEKVSPSMMKHYLYGALPGEFSTCVTALKLPQFTYSWEEVKVYLIEFCENTKNCPGKAKSKGKQDGHIFVTNDGPEEPCRNFARGRCNRGDKCKFGHSQPPKGNGKGKGKGNKGKGNDGPKCHGCGKPGHVLNDCPNLRATTAASAASPGIPKKPALSVRQRPRHASRPLRNAISLTPPMMLATLHLAVLRLTKHM